MIINFENLKYIKNIIFLMFSKKQHKKSVNFESWCFCGVPRACEMKLRFSIFM